jgi:hypothetical protein
MEITLSQAARSDCTQKLSMGDYSEMPELSKAFAAGMTPIVSYWLSADMDWTDGKGANGQRPCTKDSLDDCGERMKFSNFSVANIPGTVCNAKLTNQQPAEPGLVETNTSAKQSTMNATTLLASDDTAEGAAGGFDVPRQMLGPLGYFLAGALFMSLAFEGMRFICCRQSQQMPETPRQRTWQTPGRWGPSVSRMIHSRVLMAAEQQELERACAA